MLSVRTVEKLKLLF